MRPPVPPFTEETARAKVQAAEDAWNTRDPEKVAAAYTPDSQWRNRDEFFTGRDAIVAFLRGKWEREGDYALRKDLWAFTADRIAVRFQYESRDASGQWWRSYGNEQWEFDDRGLHAPPRGLDQRRRDRGVRAPDLRPAPGLRTGSAAPARLSQARQQPVQPGRDPPVGLPSSCISAGTSTIRTIVASTRIAVAIPMPSSFRKTAPLVTKARKTATMIAAAAVITRAVSRQAVGDRRDVSPWRRYSSRTRESRKTS